MLITVLIDELECFASVEQIALKRNNPISYKPRSQGKNKA
jgi:hypothetical protein